VRTELEEISQKYGDKRRTMIESDAGETEYTADDFIVEEEQRRHHLARRLVKRQKEVKDLATSRLREGDLILAAFAGSTRATCVFFSTRVAYTCRIVDVPARPATASRSRSSSSEGRREDRRAVSLDTRASATSRRKKPETGGRPRRRRQQRRVRLALRPGGLVEPSTRAGAVLPARRKALRLWARQGTLGARS